MTLMSCFPEDPPRFLARIPHGYHDFDLIRGELGKAGFPKSRLPRWRKPAPPHHHATPPSHTVRARPLRNEIETRDASLLGHVTEQATEAIAARFGDGPVTGKIKGYIVTARR